MNVWYIPHTELRSPSTSFKSSPNSYAAYALNPLLETRAVHGCLLAFHRHADTHSTRDTPKVIFSARRATCARGTETGGPAGGCAFTPRTAHAAPKNVPAPARFSRKAHSALAASTKSSAARMRMSSTSATGVCTQCHPRVYELSRSLREISSEMLAKRPGSRSQVTTSTPQPGPKAARMPLTATTVRNCPPVVHKNPGVGWQVLREEDGCEDLRHNLETVDQGPPRGEVAQCSLKKRFHCRTVETSAAAHTDHETPAVRSRAAPVFRLYVRARRVGYEPRSDGQEQPAQGQQSRPHAGVSATHRADWVLARPSSRPVSDHGQVMAGDGRGGS